MQVNRLAGVGGEGTKPKVPPTVEYQRSTRISSVHNLQQRLAEMLLGKVGGSDSCLGKVGSRRFGCRLKGATRLLGH
jgi:hypothetical protein